MKKIILKVIVLLALTTLVGCGEIANTDINLPENENNQQQKVDIDYAELEPYLRYFYMQYGWYENIEGSIYISELFSHFYEVLGNSDGEGIDAVLVHSIIDESDNNNFEKPFNDAYILTEAQEKRIDNGEYVVNIMADEEEYFMYSKTKEKYYVYPGSANGNIAVKIIDCKKENDLYNVTYNVWTVPGILAENYDIEELLENEDIIKQEDLNEFNIMKESKEEVAIQLQENENYNYSKYKLINFRILNDN